MVKEGFAREYTFKTPYTHQKVFQEAEQEAKIIGAGLWDKCN